MRLLIFDLGNIILPIDLKMPFERLAKLGKIPSEKEMAELTDLICSTYSRGKVETEAFISQAKNLLHINSMTDEAFIELFNSSQGKVNRKNSEYIRRLRAKGDRVVALSDMNELHEKS